MIEQPTSAADLLAWLSNGIAQREAAARKGLQPSNWLWALAHDPEAVLQRCAADRKLLELHGGRGHTCPTYDDDGDIDEHSTTTKCAPSFNISRRDMGCRVSGPSVRPGWKTDRVADNTPGDPVDLDRTPSQIAYAADEEIRALNHRTLDATTFEYPAQVADVIGALKSLTQRLDQTIGQTGSGLKHLHDQQRIGAYNGESANAQVAEAAQHLLSVQMLLAGATDGLRQAHEVLAGLQGLFDDVTDDVLEQMDGGLS